MNESQLGARIADTASVSRAGADAAVGAVFAAIADALAEGETVTVARFGKFEPRTRAVRQGRNPRTGEPVFVPVARVPTFKAATALRDALSTRFSTEPM